MKNLKSYKGICLLALFFFLNVFASKADNADVSISAFKIYPENLASGGGLNVPDKNANTSFKFHVDLSRYSRSTGGYYSGNCSFVLVYKDNYGATIDLASKDVTDANFNDASGRPTSSAIIPMTAVLPQGKLNGMLYIRFKYFNSAQNKELTEDRTNESIKVVYTGANAPLSGLFTYPAFDKYEVGVKLPDENLELKWNALLFNGAGKVIVTIYEVDATYPSVFPYPEKTIYKQTLDNTGALTFNAADLQELGVKLSFDNHFSYYVVLTGFGTGGLFGRSGLFCFVNDHPSLWPNDTPNVHPHVFWIFRPDSSGSGDGTLKVNWISDRINASNVSIDLYNEDGTFNRRLANSVPNNGRFVLPKNNGVPLGPFYQFKITSIENSSQFGYSEVFHHYLD